MSEKHECGTFLSFCVNCKVIFCARCQNEGAWDTVCPECGKKVGAGNVTAITHKIAKTDYSS